MYEHAVDDLPNECCGLILGVGDTEPVVAAETHRARNAAASPVFYELDQDDHFRIMTDGEEHGLDVVGIYHSHPHMAPRPSGVDSALANYPNLVYVIVGLREGRDGLAGTARAWRITDRGIREEPLEVIGGVTVERKG